MLALTEQMVRLYALVHVWIWMCHDLVTIDALWHHLNYTLACYSNTQQWRWFTPMRWRWCWLNTRIAYILWNGIVLTFDEQSVRLYVFVYIRIWICIYLMCDAPLHHCNRALACYSNTLYGRWNMLVRWCWCWLNIYCVYIIKRYCVGFGRTGRTLVLVHVWIWICHDSAYNPPWHHPTCILAWYSTTIAMAYCLWLITYIVFILWNGIVLALDEQEVRWYALVRIWI